MNLIEADEAFRILSDYYHHRTETQADALRGALELVPEAVVRCKDCAIAQHDELFGRWYCNGREVKPGDYCSYGERRPNES